MTSVDELMKRIEDDAATFTAEEVRQVLEHVERQALNDVYNKARIAQSAQRSAEIVQRSSDAMERLVQLIEPVTEPQFVKVGE